MMSACVSRLCAGVLFILISPLGAITAAGQSLLADARLNSNVALQTKGTTMWLGAGKGTHITIVDRFSDGETARGDLGNGARAQTHGAWVHDIAVAQAPQAKSYKHERNQSFAPIPLHEGGLNTINLSYSSLTPQAYVAQENRLNPRDQSAIYHAQNENAVVVKAAGNGYGAAIGAADNTGRVDVLGVRLIGAKSALFVGALDKRGHPNNKAQLTNYTSIAGENFTVQAQFILAGVPTAAHGLSGTSFAAPTIAAYAAALGGKYKNATPSQIAQKLLKTARKDTIDAYDPIYHGAGEASLPRALAPTSLE